MSENNVLNVLIYDADGSNRCVASVITRKISEKLIKFSMIWNDPESQDYNDFKIYLTPDDLRNIGIRLKREAEIAEPDPCEGCIFLEEYNKKNTTECLKNIAWDLSTGALSAGLYYLGAKCLFAKRKK